MNVASLAQALPVGASRRWQHALGATLALLAWVLLLYRESAASMLSIWLRSDTFAHGILVAPIVAWLIWRKREALAQQTPQAAPALLALVLLASLVWLMGELAAANALTQLALVALLVLAVPVLLGRAVARCILFPLGFLFFAVPLGEFLLPQLMEWTANFTVFALRLSGIPVYREGLNFVIPSGTWAVVEACSGVRYLIASLMVGTLFAYLNYQSTRRRWVFVAVSLLVPIVANWVRAYLIVLLGHVSGNRLATGVDHLLYGWIFFGVVILLMFMVGTRWAEPEPEPGARLAGHAEGAPLHQARGSVAALWLTAAAMAAITALPHLALWARGERTSTAPIQLTPPLELRAPWAPAQGALPAFKPAYQNPSAELNLGYVANGSVVGLYLGVYQDQGRGHALVSSDNVLVPSKDPHWIVVSSSSKSLTAEAQKLAVRASELRSADLGGSTSPKALVAWQLYWVHGTATDSDYLAKAYAALYRLTGQSDDSAVIVVYTPQGEAGQGEAALAQFLRANYSAIDALLQASGKSGGAGKSDQTANAKEGSS